MSIDLLLTGLVVLVALIYVIRRFMKPGCCAGCNDKGCGCDSDNGQCPPLGDLRDKNNEESQE